MITGCKEENIFRTLLKYKEHIEAEGFNVYAIALKGSQNYNLDDEHSDIDANVVFLPTLKQLRTKVNKKFEFETGEVVCHNLYDFAEIVAKGNPQWVELCHTKYIIGDLSMFKEHKLNPSAIKGMILEKVKAFQKECPSQTEDIKRYGYAPKQLHHILRLYDLMIYNKPIYKYTGLDRRQMLKIKRGYLPLNEAKEVMEKNLEEFNQDYPKFKERYVPQKIDYEKLDSIVEENLVVEFGQKGIRKVL